MRSGRASSCRTSILSLRRFRSRIAARAAALALCSAKNLTARFWIDRAEALGVPRGPERKQLVAGQSVSLPDGRVIAPDDVLGPVEQGASLAVVGDAGRTDDLIEMRARRGCAGDRSDVPE